jgi:hypothetical protein
VRVLRRRLCDTDTRVGAKDWILMALGDGVWGNEPLMTTYPVIPYRPRMFSAWFTMPITTALFCTMAV